MPCASASHSRRPLCRRSPTRHHPAGLTAFTLESCVCVQATLRQLLAQQVDEAWRLPGLQALRDCWQVAAVAAAFDSVSYGEAGPSVVDVHTDLTTLCSWTADLAGTWDQAMQGLLSIQAAAARDALLALAAQAARWAFGPSQSLESLARRVTCRTCIMISMSLYLYMPRGCDVEGAAALAIPPSSARSPAAANWRPPYTCCSCGIPQTCSSSWRRW